MSNAKNTNGTTKAPQVEEAPQAVAPVATRRTSGPLSDLDFASLVRQEAAPHNLALEAPKGQKAMLAAAQKVISANAGCDEAKQAAAKKNFNLALTTHGVSALLDAEARLEEASAWLEARGGSSLFKI